VVAFLAKSAADVESSLEELSACCESVEVRHLLALQTLCCAQDLTITLDLVQEDAEVRINACPTSLWGLDRIDGNDNEYAPSSIGCGATVFVIDTGIYEGHSQFDYGAKVVGRYSAIDGSSANDGNGHGTHCAGTVAGNTYGVAPGAKLYGVKVLSDSGSGTLADVVEGQCSFLDDALNTANVSFTSCSDCHDRSMNAPAGQEWSTSAPCVLAGTTRARGAWQACPWEEGTHQQRTML